jgi:hypothetical protein
VDDMDELIDFIREKTGYSRRTIKKILETEREYFLSIISTE